MVNRSRFKDREQEARQAISQMIELARLLDVLLRAHGVSPIVWNVSDDGNLFMIQPHYPEDCRPEVTEAMTLLQNRWKKELP